MNKRPEKQEIRKKWVTPTVEKINFNASEGKFGVFDEATDTQGNQIGS